MQLVDLSDFKGYGQRRAYIHVHPVTGYFIITELMHKEYSGEGYKPAFVIKPKHK